MARDSLALQFQANERKRDETWRLKLAFSQLRSTWGDIKIPWENETHLKTARLIEIVSYSKNLEMYGDVPSPRQYLYLPCWPQVAKTRGLQDKDQENETKEGQNNALT